MFAAIHFQLSLSSRLFCVVYYEKDEFADYYDWDCARALLLEHENKKCQIAECSERNTSISICCCAAP
jgi:hypothetical protein